MRFGPIALIACIAVAGCDGAGAPNGGGPAGSGQDVPVNAPAPPASLSAGSLALYPDLPNDEPKLVVGSRVEDALTLYQSPGKGIVPTPLPKGLSAEDYVATGWEKGDSTEGVGLISDVRTKHVLAAIVRQTVDDDAAANTLVAAYTDKAGSMKPEVITRGRYTYSFWEDGDNRLMILESPGKGSKIQLTLALGIKQVLNFLRADPDHARIDAGKAAIPNPEINGAPSGS